ncbi:MAG: hypothetical protein NE334_08160 [Lentisphaeraceae bacterium]|nr:hypothetical protein [Lentisphaeraceae bacterium]
MSLATLVTLSCSLNSGFSTEDEFIMSTVDSPATRIIQHEFTMVHPGDPDAYPLDLSIIQKLDENDNPFEYNLWVNSVICRDKSCEIVRVEMTWDAIGRFQKYRVEPGHDLTKLDHVPFDKEDHAKLLGILKDRESPMREVTKDGLVGKKAKSAVDGVAGATLLTLSSIVVVGAGYTCYDLWHWANGAMVQKIRQLSSQQFTEKALSQMLNSSEDAVKFFALTSLRERKLFGQDAIDAVIRCVQTGGDELIKPCLDYLQLASKTTPAYHQNLVKVFDNCSSKKRVFILDFLGKSDEAIATKIYEGLAAKLPELTTFHEINMFLTLVEKKGVKSTFINSQTAELLSHKKFFFSRRAYWFLEKQELTGEIQKKTSQYKEKYAERL